MNGSTTGLRSQMRAVEHDYPGWHLFLSSSGDVWAVTCENHAGGCGTTLEAPSPEAMRGEIARKIREWLMAAVA